MSAQDTAWEDDHWCYVCGKENPEGLKLDFTLRGRELETVYRAERRHQGYRGVLHGGILAMLMDEVLVHLPYRLFNVWTVTAEINVRLVRPAPTGEAIRVRAFFPGEAEADARLFRVNAECSLPDGTVVARAEGKCVRV